MWHGSGVQKLLTQFTSWQNRAARIKKIMEFYKSVTPRHPDRAGTDIIKDSRL